MGTINGGTIIGFTPNPSLHAVTSRMPSHHPIGCANFTFQIPTIANSSKKSINSAERRANHNAIERARRECLNTKFQELAHALPSLAQVRRPSKSIIVQKSLEFIHNSRKKDDLHEKEMRSIRSENESLREEMNKLREQLGLEPLPPREESKSFTSQQADDAKEDAKISTQTKTPEIKMEADKPIPTTTQESTNSIDNNVDNNIENSMKIEENRSEDDYSNGNTDDDFDTSENSELIDGKSTKIRQSIESQQNLYDSLIYQTLLDPNMNQHTEFSTEFDFSIDISHMNPMIDPNSLQLQFDQHDSMRNDMGTFCDTFSLIPKFYPSPPYETTMLDMTGDHISGFSIAPDNSQM